MLNKSIFIHSSEQTLKSRRETRKKERRINMAGQKNGKRIRRKIVSFEVTDAQYEAIAAECKRTGNGISVIMRDLIVRYIMDKA